MTETNSLRPKHSVHPGRFVRTVIIDPLGLTVTEAAPALGISQVALKHFLKEQAAPLPVMAIRLDKSFVADRKTLLKMQGSYDLARARQRQGEISVDRYVFAEDETRKAA